MASLSLQRVIAKEFSRPFVWGECDCCLAVANVLVTLGAEDVAAPWRGTYDSAMVMRRPLVDEIEARIAELGWPEVSEPEAGCFGFEAEGRIFDGRNWWGKSMSGMVRVQPPAKMWRPLCHQ